jgi:hypothetical protein
MLAKRLSVVFILAAVLLLYAAVSACAGPVLISHADIEATLGAASFPWKSKSLLMTLTC